MRTLKQHATELRRRNEGRLPTPLVLLELPHDERRERRTGEADPGPAVADVARDVLPALLLGEERHARDGPHDVEVGGADDLVDRDDVLVRVVRKDSDARDETCEYCAEFVPLLPSAATIVGVV